MLTSVLLVCRCIRVTGIYLITHKASRKVYVGCSRRIELRWSQHETALIDGSHSNRELQAAFNADGFAGLRFEVVQECESHELPECERTWINRFDAKRLFNRPYPKGSSSRKGLRPLAVKRPQGINAAPMLYVVTLRCADCCESFTRLDGLTKACPKCDGFNLDVDPRWEAERFAGVVQPGDDET